MFPDLVARFCLDKPLAGTGNNICCILILKLPSNKPFLPDQLFTD
jgi:hypothetical protein